MSRFVVISHSPTDTELAEWDTIDGFKYPKGSIYDLLNAADIKWRLCSDRKDNPGGNIAQVAAIKGIRLDLVHSMATFASDLKAAYPSQYTFIEPNYGNIHEQFLRGGLLTTPDGRCLRWRGLDQDRLRGHSKFPALKFQRVVIVYDEHGGFYDSCAPGPAKAPGDEPSNKHNKFGFRFEQLGVRVPAVVVSPYIPAGTVDHTVYDHASIPATLERLFKLKSLTARDSSAKDILSLLTLSSPRNDCPATLVNPALRAPRPAVAVGAPEQAAADAQPLPTSGNVRGFLAIAAKTDLELSAGTDAEKAAIVQNHHNIKTKGHAKNYIQTVMAKVEATRSKQ